MSRRPDLVDMERVQVQSNRENLEQAFEIAERLGVTRLLDAEGEQLLRAVRGRAERGVCSGPHSFCSPSADVDVPSPDEKSVITYVSSIYDAFPKVPEGGEGISAIVSNAAQHQAQEGPGGLPSALTGREQLLGGGSFPRSRGMRGCGSADCGVFSPAGGGLEVAGVPDPLGVPHLLDQAAHDTHVG